MLQTININSSTVVINEFNEYQHNERIKIKHRSSLCAEQRSSLCVGMRGFFFSSNILVIKREFRLILVLKLQKVQHENLIQVKIKKLVFNSFDFVSFNCFVTCIYKESCTFPIHSMINFSLSSSSPSLIFDRRW